MAQARLFQTQTQAINYIKRKLSLTTKQAREYLSKNTFTTSDDSDRIWVKVPES